MGLGGFIGAQANFKVFSWGDPKGTTDLALKGNPLGYFKVRIGDGLAIGLSARFNDHGGGSLSVSAGGGFGGQAIVKPPAMGDGRKSYELVVLAFNSGNHHLLSSIFLLSSRVQGETGVIIRS